MYLFVWKSETSEVFDHKLKDSLRVDGKVAREEIFFSWNKRKLVLAVWYFLRLLNLTSAYKYEKFLQQRHSPTNNVAFCLHSFHSYFNTWTFQMLKRHVHPFFYITLGRYPKVATSVWNKKKPPTHKSIFHMPKASVQRLVPNTEKNIVNFYWA